jgi:hypothetical protein
MSPTHVMAIPKPPPGRKGVMAPATLAAVRRGIKKSIEMVTPDSCSIDPRVQRDRDPRRIKKLAEEWDDLAFQPATVSRRSDGSVIVLDGQTRFGALQLLGRGGDGVETIVYRGLEIEEEARIFRILNNTKKLTRLDLFHVACIEKDPKALAINEMIESHGYKVMSGVKNGLTAIQAVIEAYDRDPVSTERTLVLASQSWGNVSKGVNNFLIRGLSVFLFRYGDAVNMTQMIERLRRGEQTDPDSMVGRSRTLASVGSITIPDAVATTVTNIYNFGRTTKKLPNWDASA